MDKPFDPLLELHKGAVICDVDDLTVDARSHGVFLRHVDGTVISVSDDDIVVDIGYKSEGVIAAREFGPAYRPKVGQKIEVLLEAVEDES
ncbi:unnamed protein product, partial [marine sediment metagenome]